MILRLLVCCVFLGNLALCLDRGQEIPLWPDDKVPGQQDAGKPDISEPSSNSTLPKRFTFVNHPSVYAFLPPEDQASGVAVIVAPGGGHSQLVIEKEGWDIAEWLNKNGIAAFVLKYRLARAPESHYSVVGDELTDASRAVRMVRCRAAEWHLKTDKIGFMGFSAGGELAALIETRFDRGQANASDPIERASSRPDFAVDVYPGLSNPISVPKDAPPTFLVCADDDPTHVVATVNLYLALQKEGIP